MIARVWRGWADADRADAYEAHYRTEVRASLGNVAGFVEARLLRRTVDEEVEFISLTFFDNLDASPAPAANPCTPTSQPRAAGPEPEGWTRTANAPPRERRP